MVKITLLEIGLAHSRALSLSHLSFMCPHSPFLMCTHLACFCLSLSLSLSLSNNDYWPPHQKSEPRVSLVFHNQTSPFRSLLGQNKFCSALGKNYFVASQLEFSCTLFKVKIESLNPHQKVSCRISLVFMDGKS